MQKIFSYIINIPMFGKANINGVFLVVFKKAIEYIKIPSDKNGLHRINRHKPFMLL